jgi:hypothetical protein
MSTAKKIWIAAAIFVTVMIGFSIFIIKISGYDDVMAERANPTVKKPVKQMSMKCGVGKCGAAMMDEVDESTAKK